MSVCSKPKFRCSSSITNTYMNKFEFFQCSKNDVQVHSMSQFCVNKVVFLPSWSVSQSIFSKEVPLYLVALRLPLLFVCRFCMSCDQRVVPKSTRDDVSGANFGWKEAKNMLQCYVKSMWKFHDFSITQILREINFRDCRSAKSAIFTR